MGAPGLVCVVRGESGAGSREGGHGTKYNKNKKGPDKINQNSIHKTSVISGGMVCSGLDFFEQESCNLDGVR